MQTLSLRQRHQNHAAGLIAVEEEAKSIGLLLQQRSTEGDVLERLRVYNGSVK
jgi:hypothetical protein